jgi:hypothetical protein
MKIIRFDTGTWKLSQEEFNYYTPNNDGIIEGFKFYINSDIKKCDYWIVRGTIQSNFALVRCLSDQVIFLLDEAYEAAEYPELFLKQFDLIIGPKNVIHHSYYKHHEMYPWLFKNVSFTKLLTSNITNKHKDLCIIASDATWLQGHRNRFAFVNKMIGHFKDKIDVYGRGFNTFDCKYEILKNYKYSICIENSNLPDYFTEKINECYLAECMPIYFGCTNIGDYYDIDSMVSIDISNFQNAISKIENAIQSNLWEQNLEKIRLMKIKYLEQFHLPIGLVNILKLRGNTKHSTNLILHKKFFEDINLSNTMLKKGFIQVISKYAVKWALYLKR